jgi:hypothetical protein
MIRGTFPLIPSFGVSLLASKGHAQQVSATESRCEENGVTNFSAALFGLPHTARGATITYGPALYRGEVEGNDGRIADLISNGSFGRMRGFICGLEGSEIDAVVEYLKIAERPRRQPKSGSQ